MKLFTKLLLATLLPALVVVVLSSVSTYVNLQRGFMTYVGELESRRLDPVVEALAAIHAEEGSFDGLADDPKRWADTLRTGAEGDSMPHAMPPGPPPHGPPPHARPGPRRPPPGRPDPLDLPHRVQLFDAAGERIIGEGPLGPEAVRKPITADGEQVGTMAIRPIERIGAEPDLAYLTGQRQAIITVTALALCLAGLVAAVVSRHLSGRVGELAEGARQLAAGHYATQLPSDASDELGALARDFNALALALDEARRTRERWIADTSHELRTPLTVLQAELEAMQDGIRPLDLEQVARLHAELGLLNRLIDDLAMLSRADQGALDYAMQRVELGELTRSLAEQHRASLEARGLRLEYAFEPALMARGDALRLRQLVTNLLENARRYTDAPGTVRVRVWSTAQRVHLRVEDSPPGPPRDALPRLFERFYRPDAGRSRAHGGSGLGLAICAQIASAHQGSLRAEPSALGGLAVELELPKEG